LSGGFFLRITNNRHKLTYGAKRPIWLEICQKSFKIDLFILKLDMPKKLVSVVEAPLTAPTYQSVKLPSWLVAAAKVQAQLFRRSTAGQIEYWAELGRQYERSGLTIPQVEEVLKREDSQASAA
jgi:hypothetical protein